MERSIIVIDSPTSIMDVIQCRFLNKAAKLISRVFNCSTWVVECSEDQKELIESYLLDAQSKGLVEYSLVK